MSEPGDIVNVPFREQLHLLSIIMPLGDYKRQRNRHRMTKRLDLLDSTSLLLCTGAEGEQTATAVTYESNGSGIHIYYSKNRPCKEEEKKYIARLLEIVKDGVNPDILTQDILRHVIAGCQGKIVSRFNKLTREITFLQDLSPNGDISFNLSVDFEHYVRTADILGGSVPEDMQMDQLMNVVMDAIAFDNDNLDPERVEDFLRIIYRIASARGIETVISQHPVLLWRLRRMGSIFGAVENIALATLYDRRIAPNKKLITITEVRPPSPMLESISTSGYCDPVHILNRLAKASGKKPPREEALKALCQHYDPIARPYTDPSVLETQVKVAVHCELSLLNFMVERRFKTHKQQPVSMNIEIGTSRPVCWMCHAYMNQIEKSCTPPYPRRYEPEPQILKCIFKEYTNRIHGDWKMPNCCPVGFDYKFPGQTVLKIIEEIIDLCHDYEHINIDDANFHNNT